MTLNNKPASDDYKSTLSEKPSEDYSDSDTPPIVNLNSLETLWINTGTLCNLSCPHCYIESSPTNNRLLYPTLEDIIPYFEEISKYNMPTKEIGFTGGEPFMNPNIMQLIEETLNRGFSSLILTNAMRPMMKKYKDLLLLQDTYGDLIKLRISIDHYKEKYFAEERGKNSWNSMCLGLNWLNDHGFNFTIAARKLWNEPEEKIRDGFQDFFNSLKLRLDPYNNEHLVIFPEMPIEGTTQKITKNCLDILDISIDKIMCARSRMIVKKRESQETVVMPCTLIPYEKNFELGSTLTKANKDITLNHPNCSSFCILGGGSCN
ncbi:MAG: radical SAM protein [Rhodospirillaceae bacterium]|nr:radical SAM protein [Rhodospirillaceae bacterium]|tara:strand:- start:31742 stop:32698 length:957 start_codon:yes stop_codon:yes gene_type:complete